MRLISILALSAIILFIWVIVGERFIKKSNADKWNTIFTISGSVGATLVLVFLGLQVHLQTETFNLEKRPYLYLHFDTVFNYSGGKPYGPGFIVFKNEGRIPAGDVDLKFRLWSDVIGEIKTKKWHIDVLGGMPEVKTVFPQHVDARRRLAGHIGRTAKFVAVEALVTYTGTEEGKVYWFSLYNVYNVRPLHESKKVRSTTIITDTDWDRNSKPVPVWPKKGKQPDWSQYKDRLGTS